MKNDYFSKLLHVLIVSIFFESLISLIFSKIFLESFSSDKNPKSLRKEGETTYSFYFDNINLILILDWIILFYILSYILILYVKKLKKIFLIILTIILIIRFVASLIIFSNQDFYKKSIYRSDIFEKIDWSLFLKFESTLYKSDLSMKWYFFQSHEIFAFCIFLISKMIFLVFLFDKSDKKTINIDEKKIKVKKKK